MVFYWSLSDSKSLQVSKTLSILTDINKYVCLDALLLSSYLQFFQSFVPSVTIIIGITVTFTSHIF